MTKREIISISFIVSLLISNILATKLISVGTIVLPAAVIIYPLCFMMGDVLTEVWGYGYAKKVIYTGFIANFTLVLFTYLGGVLPPANFWPNQDAYIALFGMVPRIVFASFIAYLFGELINSWSLEKIKEFTGVRLLFIRTIGSSVAGQLFDTALFIGIAFYGTIPNSILIQMMIAQYVTKIGLEALAGTPLAYMLVSWARKSSPSLINNPGGRGATCES